MGWSCSEAAGKEMTDAANQKVLMAEGGDRMLQAMKAFIEIMTGPNPLSKEEIAKLHKKRPHLSFLERWY